jgi:hypothetical protein
MTNNIRQACRDIATRMENAATNMIESLMELGEIDSAAATKVYNLYRRHKLIKLNAVLGRYDVNHGAYLDRDTIRRAVVLADEQEVGERARTKAKPGK